MQYAWLLKLDLITNSNYHKLYKSHSKIKQPQLSNRITSILLHPFGRAAWAVGSLTLRSDCLSVWLVSVWDSELPELCHTDFLLKSMRLLTPQVPQQQHWHIGCILVVKRAFQQWYYGKFQSRNLVIWSRTIPGFQEWKTVRDSSIPGFGIPGLQSLGTVTWRLVFLPNYTRTDAPMISLHVSRYNFPLNGWLGQTVPLSVSGKLCQNRRPDEFSHLSFCSIVPTSTHWM